MIKGILIIPLVLASSTLYAVETPTPNWKGEAELGYMKTTGNTETESFHAKGKVINNRVQWRHTVIAEISNKNNSDVSTAERYFLSGKSDYKINDLSFLFASINYEDDRFSGYAYQVSEVIGYGYNVIKKDHLKLDLEAGAGARQSKLDSGTSNNEGLVKGSANLDWKISDTTIFIQYLSLEVGEDITISRSKTALKIQIVGNLAAKISHDIKHSSDVPVGFNKTDSESIVTLVYGF